MYFARINQSKGRKKSQQVFQISLIFTDMSQAPNSYRKPKEVVTRETTNDGIKYYDPVKRMWVVFKTQEKMDSFLERMKMEEKMYLSR